MDAFRLLKQDHKEVRSLFKKLAGSKPSKGREKGLQQLHQALAMHMDVEERLLYPRLHEEKKLRELANESYEEHHAATLLLDELRRTDMEDERWDAKLSVLKEVVEHHLHEEEKEIFPKAAKALGREEANALGRQIEEAKKEHIRGRRREKVVPAVPEEQRAPA